MLAVGAPQFCDVSKAESNASALGPGSVEKWRQAVERSRLVEIVQKDPCVPVGGVALGYDKVRKSVENGMLEGAMEL